MSFIDRAINVASDAAKATAANHQRAQRHRALYEQIAAQQQVIMDATMRIGRMSLQADGPANPLPETARPAAEAIGRWRAEIDDLHAQLHQILGPAPSPPCPLCSLPA